MWNSLGKLWLDHLKIIHETATKSQSPVTLESLRTRIRLIHELQTQAQPYHSHYFQDDLDGFLQKSTIQSMTTYITQYLPPIIASIQSRQDAMSVYAFLPIPVPPPSAPESSAHQFTPGTLPISPLSHDTLHPAQEESPHRKRNRPEC
jgi:hypothetical protein